MPRANENKLVPETDPVREGSKTIQVTYVTGKQSTVPWALDIEIDEWRLTYTERFIGKELETKELEVQGFINLNHVLELEINEVY